MSSGIGISVQLSRAGAVVAVGLHVDEVDHAADVVLGADRDLGRDDVLAEGGLELVERAEEVGALAVEHVHEDHPREVELGGALPQARRRDLDAHHGVDDEDGRLADAQRAERVGDEAGLTGRVDQVDLAVVPLERAEVRADRHLPRLLVGVGVRDRSCRRRRTRGDWWLRPGRAAPRAARSCHSLGGRQGPHCGCGPPCACLSSFLLSASATDQPRALSATRPATRPGDASATSVAGRRRVVRVVSRRAAGAGRLSCAAARRGIRSRRGPRRSLGA